MERLTELLHPSPQMKIMAVTSCTDGMVEVLGSFVAGHNGSMDVSLYPGEHREIASEGIGKVDTIRDYRSPLRVATRDYEAVIVRDILHLHEMPLKLLGLIYRSMENSAEIIVVQSHGSVDHRTVEGWIEEAEFRAVNTITDLIAGCDVIVAKKMHMWGNGL